MKITYRRLLSTVAAGALCLGSLSGCAVSQAQSTEITTVLTQLGNTLTSDLANQRAVALAATPPDNDGAACAGVPPDPTKPGDLGTGAQAVAAAIKKVAAATAGQQVGPLTVAEIATLYQPGSVQFNWAVTTLETSCIAKIHDTNQAINSTSGIITAIPTILALGAAPAGL